jgi:hypothetical protein
MNKGIIFAIVAAAIAIPAGIYAASPLFINTSVDEPAPIEADVMAKDQGGMMDDKVVEMAGKFVGVDDGIHNAEGMVRVIQVDGGEVLRLEDLKVTNGPDLYVYLATDKKASDFVDLGRLKANNGNQNYEIPAGTDLSKYNTVLVWCKQFSVLFGSAELTSSMSA